jgi:hypothetical protein
MRTNPTTLALALVLMAGGCEPEARIVSDTKPPTYMTMTLPDAVMEASVLRNAYETSLINQSRSKGAIGLFLTGIGAAAAAVGLSRGHAASPALLGLGVAGLGVYEIGDLFTGGQRSQIYLAGIDALNCALQATIPLELTDVQRNGLADALNQLDIAIANSAVQGVQLDSGVTAAASAAQSSAQALLQQIAFAGPTLDLQIRKINAAVDRQLVSAEPNPVAIWGSLSSTFHITAPGTLFSTGVKQAGQVAGADREGAQASVIEKTAELQSLLAVLAVSQQNSLTAMGGCLVAAPTAANTGAMAAPPVAVGSPTPPPPGQAAPDTGSLAKALTPQVLTAPGGLPPPAPPGSATGGTQPATSSPGGGSGVGTPNQPLPPDHIRN